MKLRTMEEALKKYPNRFQLTMMAAARAKELNRYQVEKMDADNTHKLVYGEEPLVRDIPGRKPVVLALREIAEGNVVSGEREMMDKIKEARRVVREKALLAEQPELDEDEEVDAVTDDSPAQDEEIS